MPSGRTPWALTAEIGVTLQKPRRTEGCPQGTGSWGAAGGRSSLPAPKRNQPCRQLGVGLQPPDRGDETFCCRSHSIWAGPFKPGSPALVLG